MMGSLYEALLSPFCTYPFLIMALWASLLASFASGVIGSLIVVKRVVFLAGSISHSVLGGMGLCLWLQRTRGWIWLDPMYGAFATAILSALIMGWIHLRFRQREDAVISAMWSTGMAVGVIFISLTPGTNVELVNFLFGNILWIREEDLWLLLGMDLVIAGALAWYYRPLLALCHDEEQALLQGVPVQRLYLLLLSLVALSIVILIQMIGTILVLALLTLPATLANLWVRRLWTMMGCAVLLSICFSFSGLGIAYVLDWPPGATIALLAAITYLFGLSRGRFSLTKRFRSR